MTMSPEVAQELDAVLTIKRDSVEAVFKKVEVGIDSAKQTLVEKLDSESTAIRAAIEAMDAEVRQLIGFKETEEFVFEKLELFGD